MKYYLIGVYPPPLGGVSVYIYRFRKMLEKSNISPEIVDLSKMHKIKILIWLLKVLTEKRACIFNLNNFNFLPMLVLFLRPFKKKVIFTVHSGHNLYKLKYLNKRALKYFLTSVDELILVGENIKDKLIESGYILPEKVTVKNSFLPPPEEEEEEILKTYGNSIIDFIDSHYPVIIANASKIAFFNNEDLYGLDLCVKLTGRLKQIYPNIGFLFALADDRWERNYLQAINEIIEKEGLTKNFKFMTGNKEIWPILKRVDLMIRPTNTDSFGISVAESIYFGCPAIASNVCIRPKGTILFRSRDIDDLVEKSKQVLSNGNLRISSQVSIRV